MHKSEKHVPIEEFHYSSINRKVTRNDIVDCLRQGFPLIYDSVSRGRGLALGIIKYLYEHGEASMYTLKKEFKVELHSIKKILSRMEEKGYVTHRTEKGRGPKGKYVYSLTPLGGIVYSTIFLHKPYSWIIDDFLKNGNDVYVLNFLKENEEILKNKALEELFNYLFIKYTRAEINTVEQAFHYVMTGVSASAICILTPGLCDFAGKLGVEASMIKEATALLTDILQKGLLSKDELHRLALGYIEMIHNKEKTQLNTLESIISNLSQH